MSRVKDLRIVRVATPDAEAATAAFRRLFGLSVTRSARDDGARTSSTFLAIGAAEIEMEAPSDATSPLQAFLAERGAGLHEIVLEVDDLERASGELAAKGVTVARVSVPGGRSYGTIDPAQTHGVRITLVAR